MIAVNCPGCGLVPDEGETLPGGRCVTCARIVSTWAPPVSLMMMAVVRVARLNGCRCDPTVEPAPPGLVLLHPDHCPLRRASMAYLN